MNYFQNFYFMNTQTFNLINLVPDNKYIPMELNMYLLNSNSLSSNVLKYN